MKKKIINGLLFAAALVTATSSFVSCKDYEGDNYAELQEKYATLQDAITAQATAMRDYVLLTESGWTRNELATATIKARLEQLGINCNAYTDQEVGKAKTYTDEEIAKIKTYTDTQINNLRTEIQNWTNQQLTNYYTKNEMDILLAQKLDEAKGYTDTELTKYKNEWESVWKDDLQKAIEQAAVVEANSSKWNQAYEWIAAGHENWDQAYEWIDDGREDWDRIKELVDQKSEAWQKATDLVEKITAEYQEGWDVGGEEKAATIQDVIDYFKTADSKFAADIKDLQDLVSEMLQSMQAEITGITIQATNNPIFGSFAYPVDVQSNILATYFGEVTNGDFDFPVGDQYLDLWVGGVAPILKSELDDINAPAYHVPAEGILMHEGAGNAGKLYLTINPSNVTGIENGKYFTLRTSDNQVSKVVLSALEPCTEQLKWGYQRANSANGFYVATAEIKKDDVKNVALSFEAKKIASEIQNIMQDFSKTSAADVAKLALDIAQSMKVDAPRLGVQAQWQDPVSGWKNYVSKYDLAAVSVRPLGFHDLYGADYSPAIVKLKNKIIAKEKSFSQELINEIKGMINVQIGLPETAGDIRTTADGKVFIDLDINVSIPGVPFTASTEKQTTTITIGIGQLGSIPNPMGGTILIPEEAKTITVNIPAIDASGTSNTISTNVKKSIEITSLFNAIRDGIQKSLGGIDKMTGKIEDIVNRIINVENRLFGRLESVLKNPNRFMQPALIAQGQKGFFYPSRIYTHPTKVAKGTKIMFHPTSLNAEIAAPAFKKYVAVCGAWDADNNDKGAKKFNSGVMNTVFDGNEYNLQKPFEYTVNAPVGTVLEIIYECLGFDGKVAGKKYYIEVSE